MILTNHSMLGGRRCRTISFPMRLRITSATGNHPTIQCARRRSSTDAIGHVINPLGFRPLQRSTGTRTYSIGKEYRPASDATEASAMPCQRQKIVIPIATTIRRSIVD